MAHVGRIRWSAWVLAFALSPTVVSAEEGGSFDNYYLHARTQTHLHLFQDALLPGPSGALVRTQTQLPVVQYLQLDATHLDSPLGPDTGRVELSLWAGAELADRNAAAPVDGDVQTAAVTIQTSPTSERKAWITLGRQVEAGGAGRFVRFDGGSAGIAILPELTLGVYGGLLVLPRWDRRPGYYHLGSAADSLLRDPEAFEDPSRGGHALVGGRVSFDSDHFHATASIHEQRDAGELGRRNLGLDTLVPLSEAMGVGAAAMLDVDSMRLATARAFFDATLGERIDLSAEYSKAEPALLLSRQSVLSVFSTSGYHEAGGTVGFRATDTVRVTSEGYVQFYDDSLPGTRWGLGGLARTSHHPSATTVSAGYGRVDAVELGYHSIRVAARQPLIYDMMCTLQAFAYFYDREIQASSKSLTGSLAVSYPFARNWELLWAASAARTPYAAFDGATQLRLSYRFSETSKGALW